MKIKRIMKYFPIAAAALALIALIVGLAAPSVVRDLGIGSERIEYFSGWRCVFGYKVETDFIVTTVTKVLSFSFWNLLTYILLVVGIAACVVSIVKPELSWLGYVAACCFVGSTVLFFCACPSTVFANVNDKELAKYLSLGAGAIIGAILSILAVLLAAATPVLKLLADKKVIKLK